MVPMHVHRALAQMQSKATIRRHALPRVAQRCKTGLDKPPPCGCAHTGRSRRKTCSADAVSTSSPACSSASEAGGWHLTIRGPFVTRLHLRVLAAADLGHSS
jgi:hypothetical protein